MRWPPTTAILTLLLACFATVSNAQNRAEFRDGTLEVTVVDEFGTPLPGIEVECAKAHGFELPPSESFFLTSDASGKCTFTGLLKGNYLLHAEVGAIGSWELTHRLHEEQPVIAHTLTLGVHYTEAGVVHDIDDQPIPGIEVYVANSTLAALTDREGRYEIQHLFNERLGISLKKDGYAFRKASSGAPGDHTHILLEKGVRLTVKVLDETGHPMPNTWVHCNALRGHFSVTGTSNALGECDLGWVPFDPAATVQAGLWIGEQWYKENLEVELDSDKHTATLNVRPMVTPDTPKIAGRIVMQGTGIPVAGKLLIGENSTDWLYGRKVDSDTQGHFLVDRIQPGTSTINVIGKDRRLLLPEGPMQVTVPDSTDPVEIEIEMAMGAEIRGTVFSADGLPVSNQWVEFRVREEGYPQAFNRNTLQKDGTFSIFSIPPTSQHQKLVCGKASVEIPPLQAGQVYDNVELVLEDIFLQPQRHSTIYGTLLDTRGLPMVGVDVHIKLGGSTEYSRTRGDGTFELPVNKPGEAKFEVTRLRTHHFATDLLMETEFLPVLQGKTLNIGSSTAPKEIVIVAARQDPTAVRGTIRDEAGNLLTPDMDYYFVAFYDDPRRGIMGSMHPKRGRFFKNGEQNGILVLGFYELGYKPKLLFSGRDFEIGDTDINVVLEKGSFAEGTDVYAAVVGPDHPSVEHITNLYDLNRNVGRWTDTAAGIERRHPNPEHIE